MTTNEQAQDSGQAHLKGSWFKQVQKFTLTRDNSITLKLQLQQ